MQIVHCLKCLASRSRKAHLFNCKKRIFALSLGVGLPPGDYQSIRLAEKCPNSSVKMQKY